MSTSQPDLFGDLEFNLAAQHQTELPAPSPKLATVEMFPAAEPTFAPTKLDKANASRYNITLTFSLVNEGPFNQEEQCGRADQVADYMKGAFDSHPEQEAFWVIILDRKNRAKGRQLITLGTQNNSLVHPREVFRAAVIGGAAAIVCVHNHPSGDPSPSAADVQVTRQLREASKTLNIELVDHVIIGNKASDPAGLGFYSFRAAGLI
jgi:DNA repair protein RadC